MTGLMAGKRGLIMGLANDRSLAWGIAKALADQGAERMHDPTGIAAVPEARGNPVNQADRPVGLPQQQRPGIRRHRPAVDGRLYAAAIEPFETKLFGDTLCRHRPPPCDLIKPFSHNNFLRSPGPMHLLW